MKNIILFIFISCLATSCSTIIHEGTMLEENKITQLRPGLSYKADVENILGSPSFVIENKWYYVSIQKKQRAFFIPKILEHKALQLTFDDNDLLTKAQQADHKTTKVNHERKVKLPIFKKPNLYEILKDK